MSIFKFVPLIYALAHSPLVGAEKLNEGWDFQISQIEMETNAQEKLRKIDALLAKTMVYKMPGGGTNEALALIGQRFNLCTTSAGQCLDFEKFFESINTLERMSDAKRLDMSRVVETYWGQIPSQIKTASGASSIVTQFQKIRPGSNLAFKRSLMLISDFHAKGFKSAAIDLASWFAKSYKQPPKDDVVGALSTFNKATREIRSSEQEVPREVLRDLATTAAGWITPALIKAVPPGKVQPFIETLVPMLRLAGHPEITFAISKMVTDDILVFNLQGSMILIQDVCAYSRSEGRVSDCEEFVNRMQKIAEFRKYKIQDLDLERSRIAQDKGDLVASRKIIKSIIADIPETDPRANIVMWMYYDLAAIAMATNDYAEVQRNLNEHWRMKQALAKGKTSQDMLEEKMPMLMLQTSMLIRQGKFKPALENIELLEKSLGLNFGGQANLSGSLSILRLEIACIQRDKPTIAREYAKAKKIFEKIPKDVQVPYMNILIKASQGTYTPKDLEALSTIIGAKSIGMENFKRMIEVVVKAKPTAPK